MFLNVLLRRRNEEKNVTRQDEGSKRREETKGNDHGEATILVTKKDNHSSGYTTFQIGLRQKKILTNFLRKKFVKKKTNR